MRFFARAAGIDHVWGVVTNLFDWNILFYNKEIELCKEMVRPSDIWQCSIPF